MNISNRIKNYKPECDREVVTSAYLEEVKKIPQTMLCKIDSDIVEVKQDGEDFYQIEGYAATYGNIDKGCDRIEKGAFDTDIATNGNVRTILWQHDPSQPIGNGYFKSDDKGLYVTVQLPKNDDFIAKRVYPQLKIGSVKKFSIGYFIKEYSFTEEENDILVLNLKKLELRETSIVTFAMNEEADILSVKSDILDKIQDSIKEDTKDKKTKDDSSTKKYEVKYACTDDSLKVDDTYFEGMDAYLKEHDIELKDVSFTFGDKTFYFAGIKNDELQVIPSRLAEAINYITEDMIAEKAIINAYYKQIGREIPFKEDGTFYIDKYTIRHLDKKTLCKCLLADGVEISGNATDFLAEAVSLTSELGKKHEEAGEEEDFSLLETFAEEFSKITGE